MGAFSVKRRLTTYFLLIATLGIALSSAFGVWVYRDREISSARQTLVELLNLMDAQNYYTDAEAWSQQLHTAAPDKRLTIISPEGKVLSDTYGQVTENHADRPEFKSALETGWGEAERKSDTTGEMLLYEAKQFTDGNVGRLSMPISSVNALVLQGLVGFLVAAVVALVLMLVLARKLADRTAQPLEQKEEELEQEGEKLQTVRKSGLTFAPEAGTQRLRDVINKNLTEEEILDTCARAFSGGWNNVKLYFMLGLPTETDEDVLGIAKLVYQVIKTWQAHASNKKRGLRVHVATAYFVPKPFTPFQWEQQIPPEEYLRRTRLLKNAMPSKAVVYNWHAPDLSRLEAALARGDRRLGPVIAWAVEHGAHLDGWDEYFQYGLWLDAFAACGLDPDFYTVRGYGEGELLPWQTLSVGVDPGFLLRERRRAYEGLVTPDCRQACAGCGANRLLKEVGCDA